MSLPVYRNHISNAVFGKVGRTGSEEVTLQVH